MVQLELREVRPSADVVARPKAQAPNTVFLSAMTICEIETGIQKQRSVSPKFAEECSQWLAQTELQFARSIIPATAVSAKLWGRPCVQTGNKGIDDTLIAATKLVHNLLVLTRSVKDFEVVGVRVFDPYEGA